MLSLDEVLVRNNVHAIWVTCVLSYRTHTPNRILVSDPCENTDYYIYAANYPLSILVISHARKWTRLWLIL